jgi:glycogen debranching enzyme
LVWHHEGTVPGGLSQQGWRDSRDPTASKGTGIVRPDRTAPTAPFADLDTQAVAVAALRAAATLSGDPAWHARAEDLCREISDRYLPDVIQLEADGRPVPGMGSSLGWLLWADAVPHELIDGIADRLRESDILTPFGIRTLSSASPVFDAAAYHRGSIWPFDSWLAWGGLRAAGRTDEAEQIRRGVLDAITRIGLYPELYTVTLDGHPQPLPVSNHVQAWTVGAAWALHNHWDGRSAIHRADTVRD